jgi:5'-nucleotidase
MPIKTFWLNSIMNILLTNDDGIHAPGIYRLKQALAEVAEVIVVAPDAECSAVGHAITLSDPLRVMEVYKIDTFFGYAVNGTPADCVKLGIKGLMTKKPDLVVSGINLGANTATNIMYSGTVSAAAEAVLMGVPGLALSIASYKIHEYDYAAELGAELAQIIHARGLRKGTLLNVNVPAVKRDEIQGVVITRQGSGRFEETVEKRIDPTNRTYYWYSGRDVILDIEQDVDDIALRENKVSITPIRYDLTDIQMISELKKWGLEK